MGTDTGTSVQTLGALGELVPEGMTDLFRPLHPSACAFLAAVLEAGTIVGAERLTGISRQEHYRRLGMGAYRGQPAQPDYERAWLAVKEALKDDARQLLHDRITNGMAEERRGPDGELLFSRIRHDPALLKMHLTALMPEEYGREGSAGVNIQIIFEEAPE